MAQCTRGTNPFITGRRPRGFPRNHPPTCANKETWPCVTQIPTTPVPGIPQCATNQMRASPHQDTLQAKVGVGAALGWPLTGCGWYGKEHQIQDPGQRETEYQCLQSRGTLMAGHSLRNQSPAKGCLFKTAAFANSMRAVRGQPMAVDGQPTAGDCLTPVGVNV